METWETNQLAYMHLTMYHERFLVRTYTSKEAYSNSKAIKFMALNDIRFAELFEESSSLDVIAMKFQD